MKVAVVKPAAIAYVALAIFSLGYSAAMHGKPKENWNFLSSLAAEAVVVGILIWGGFFQ